MLVPFELVPSLVSKREVIITSGQAKISCKQVRTYLVSLFRSVLSESLYEGAKTNLDRKDFADDDEEDHRLRNLLLNIRHVYQNTIMKRHISSRGGYVLRACDVEKVTNHFPICFRHVHRSLVRHNRLQHHARVAYTLFLKEIGLPRDEAVTFWSHFYRRDATKGCTSCSHSWDRNGKKFEYRFVLLFSDERILRFI